MHASHIGRVIRFRERRNRASEAPSHGTSDQEQRTSLLRDQSRARPREPSISLVHRSTQVHSRYRGALVRVTLAAL